MPKTSLHPKVAGGGIAGGLALIILYGLGYAIAIPAEVAATVGVLATSVGAYLSPWFAANQPGQGAQVGTRPQAPPGT